MAISCVSYLCASLELVNERTTVSESTQKVLASFYGFHLYATEHWIQHLVAYDKDVCVLRPAEASTLYSLIERLANTHDEQLHSLHRNDAPRLAEFLKDAQHPQAFLAKCYAFREGLKNRAGKTGEGKTLEPNPCPTSVIANKHIEMEQIRIENDKTLFSMVNSRYHSYVQGILERKYLPYISKETLARFKQKYEATAYTCRYPDCIRRSSGFGNVQARNDHENLRHGRGILCAQSLCLRNKVGFKNSQSLKRHVQETHVSHQGVYAFKKARFTRLDFELVGLGRLGAITDKTGRSLQPDPTVGFSKQNKSECLAALLTLEQYNKERLLAEQLIIDLEKQVAIDEKELESLEGQVASESPTLSDYQMHLLQEEKQERLRAIQANKKRLRDLPEEVLRLKALAGQVSVGQPVATSQELPKNDMTIQNNANTSQDSLELLNMEIAGMEQRIASITKNIESSDLTRKDYQIQLAMHEQGNIRRLLMPLYEKRECLVASREKTSNSQPAAALREPSENGTGHRGSVDSSKDSLSGPNTGIDIAKLPKDELERVDDIPYPPGILSSDIALQHIPANIKTWRELKSWCSNNQHIVAPESTRKLDGLQTMHVAALWKQATANMYPRNYSSSVSRNASDVPKQPGFFLRQWIRN